MTTQGGQHRRVGAIPLMAVVATAFLVAPQSAWAAEGIDLRTFAWHAFNLSLLIGIIVYFARTPIREMMATRRTQIEGELAEARTDLERAEAQLSEWQTRMNALDAELDEIRSAVRAQAEGERDRILADAEASADRIRANAVAAVEQETRRARDDLRVEGAEIAIARAGEILEQRITDGDRDRLFDEFLTHLQNRSADDASAEN